VPQRSITREGGLPSGFGGKCDEIPVAFVTLMAIIFALFWCVDRKSGHWCGFAGCRPELARLVQWSYRKN